MGKFITDNDTKKAVADFIKKQYIENGIPIGNDPLNIETFRQGFADLLKGEDWKITRIVNTTVNKMRNTAAVNYMDQAGVAQFEIVGVPDKLQCAFCASMRGKTFTVEKTLSHIADVEDTPPEMVPEVSPFLSSRGLSAEEIKNMSSESLETLLGGANIPPFHCHCYASDTEFMTEQGWKQVYDIEEGEKIMSLNPDTSLMEYVDYKKKIIQPNQEDYLYKLSTAWNECLVTNDHVLFTHKRADRGKGRVIEPRFITLHKFNSSYRLLRIPEHNNVSPAVINAGGIDYTVKDFVTLSAWYISNGCCFDHITNKGLAIACDRVKSKSKRAVMDMFVAKLAANYGIKVGYAKEKLYFVSAELHDYFKPFGFTFDKYLPEVLFKLSREDAQLFFENYMLTDGHYSEKSNEYIQGSKHRVVFTSSSRLASDLGKLAQYAGYCPSYVKKQERDVEFKNGKYTCKESWVIGLNTSKYAQGEKIKIEKVPYSGEVVCLELEKYHTLLIRSNGKVSWNGNCRDTIVAVL